MVLARPSIALMRAIASVTSFGEATARMACILMCLGCSIEGIVFRGLVRAGNASICWTGRRDVVELSCSMVLAHGGSITLWSLQLLTTNNLRLCNVGVSSMLARSLELVRHSCSACAWLWM